VSVVGEIYTVLEPVANLNLEEKLGRLGVRVVRRVFITDWVRHNLLPRFAGPSEDVVCGHASPYLNYFVGGEGIQSVGYTVMSARERLHGVVHVMPFTCMPEIVARSVLPEVQNRHNIPVLSLSFDEHTGESGLETRLEAFVDLIREKGGFRHDAGASRS
jgi:predicted nucleotide-binding protein (sugar kinase/HSP70/actin superfamily)